MKTIDNPASVRSASPEMVFAWLKEKRAHPSLPVTLGGLLSFSRFPTQVFPLEAAGSAVCATMQPENIRGDFLRDGGK